jgi:hypothetical protein
MKIGSRPPGEWWCIAVLRRLRLVPSAVRAVVRDWHAYGRLFVRSRTIHVAVVLVAAFWLVASFTQFQDLFLGVNLVIIAIEVLIMLAYLPAFLIAIVETWPLTERDQLIMGIYVAWCFDFWQRVWSLIWRYSGDAQWMIVSDMLTFFLFGRMLGAVLHVTAPSSEAGRVPAASWARIGLAFVAGVVVALILIFFAIGGGLQPF